MPKAEGPAPLKAYIAALSGWKQDVARRLDALIERTAPDVRKALKWNSPFYGMEGRGWFLTMHVFTRYVKMTFFCGTSLDLFRRGARAKLPAGSTFTKTISTRSR